LNTPLTNNLTYKCIEYHTAPKMEPQQMMELLLKMEADRKAD
jgi:hypothetical protein